MVKFKVRRASTWQDEEPLEVETLDDLLNFIKENDIVIEERNGEFNILIYDDYIE